MTAAPPKVPKGKRYAHGCIFPEEWRDWGLTSVAFCIKRNKPSRSLLLRNGSNIQHTLNMQNASSEISRSVFSVKEKRGSRFINRKGETHGRLMVLEMDSIQRRKGVIRWICKCVCGTIKSIESTGLGTGNTQSCGCLGRERRLESTVKHRRSGTPLYYNWVCMIQRCTNPKNTAYKRYGARGITVDPSWLDFSVFLKDMGERPSINHSIDRKDNSLGYSKENCKWSTKKEQSRNMRRNRIVEFEGKALCVTEWAEKLGVSAALISKRIDRGWDVKDAFFIPSKRPIKR